MMKLSNFLFIYSNIFKNNYVYLIVIYTSILISVEADISKIIFFINVTGSSGIP